MRQNGAVAGNRNDVTRMTILRFSVTYNKHIKIRKVVPICPNFLHNHVIVVVFFGNIPILTLPSLLAFEN